MNLPIITVSAILVLSSVPTSAWFWKQPTIVDQYDKLNDLLVDTVEDDSATENLLAALNFLTETTDGVDHGVSTQALVQFTSLLKLLTPNNFHCDLLGLDILKKNVEATKQPIMVSDDKLGPLRRIDTVIRDVAVEHADQCRYEYPKLFKWIRQDTSKNKVYQDIKLLMNKIIDTSSRQIFTGPYARADDRMILNEKAKGILNIREEKQSRAALLWLRERARDDDDLDYLAVSADPRQRGKWMVNARKVNELLEKYILDQCDYLVRATSHVIVPALYDQQLYSDSRKYKAIDNDNAEFMVWLQYFRLCNLMLKEDKEIFMKNVVKSIWKLDHF